MTSLIDPGYVSQSTKLIIGAMNLTRLNISFLKYFLFNYIIIKIYVIKKNKHIIVFKK
jgi:hypothetical protein